MQLRCFEMKLPNLELKTRQKQLMGSILLDIMLHSLALTSIIWQGCCQGKSIIGLII